MEKKKNTLLLGVGNVLLKDEGVGISVGRELQNETLPCLYDIAGGGTG